MYRWIKSSNDADILPRDQYDAIHEYQQTSFERLTTAQLVALQEYIQQSSDVTEELYRGMQVSEDVLNNWIDKSRIVFNQITSWTTDGAIAARFSTVQRSIDAEDGMRSVILVAPNGLNNSAKLPRTNSYIEKEALTTKKAFTIISTRKQPSLSDNKSPYIMIINVK